MNKLTELKLLLEQDETGITSVKQALSNTVGKINSLASKYNIIIVTDMDKLEDSITSNLEDMRSNTVKNDPIVDKSSSTPVTRLKTMSKAEIADLYKEYKVVKSKLGEATADTASFKRLFIETMEYFIKYLKSLKQKHPWIKVDQIAGPLLKIEYK